MGDDPLPKAAQLAQEADLPRLRKALKQAGASIDEALTALDKVDG